MLCPAVLFMLVDTLCYCLLLSVTLWWAVLQFGTEEKKWWKNTLPSLFLALDEVDIVIDIGPGWHWLETLVDMDRETLHMARSHTFGIQSGLDAQRRLCCVVFRLMILATIDIHWNVSAVVKTLMSSQFPVLITYLHTLSLLYSYLCVYYSIIYNCSVKWWLRSIVDNYQVSCVY